MSYFINNSPPKSAGGLPPSLHEERGKASQMRRGESRYQSNENATLFHSHYLNNNNNKNPEK